MKIHYTTQPAVEHTVLPLRVPIHISHNEFQTFELGMVSILSVKDKKIAALETYLEKQHQQMEGLKFNLNEKLKEIDRLKKTISELVELAESNKKQQKKKQ